MRVISWNIQWGRGADGRVDLPRLLGDLAAMGPAEVICLQEVAQNFPDLAGGACEDEPALLAAAHPGWSAVYAPGVDALHPDGRRSCFGNLILSRLPVLQVFRHLLPRPADPGQPSMQRSCAEVVVDSPGGALRILTTHLEYYSAAQRLAQAGALQALQAEVCALAAAGVSAREKDGPFRPRPRPVAALLCGDFNCEPGSGAWRAVQAEIPGGAGWVDAWPVLHGARPHDPSVGLHGAEWPERAYCCDFFFASADLLPRLRGLAVNAATAASDHQPLVLDLAD